MNSAKSLAHTWFYGTPCRTHFARVGILILKVPAFAVSNLSIAGGEQMPSPYGVFQNRDHGEERCFS